LVLSDGFLDTWRKWLNFSFLDINNTPALKDVPLWHGSLTCVGKQVSNDTLDIYLFFFV
jgi:hypothetical protein